MTKDARAAEKKRRSDWFRSLAVRADFSPKTMDSYFAQVREWLKDEMDFVGGRISFWYNLSKFVRGVAFLAVAAGVLLPIPVFPTPAGWPTGLTLGYFAIAVGGLVLLLDRSFNVSSAWVRLTLAEMKVKQIRYRLDLDWATRRPLLTAANGATEGPALIALLRAATDAAHAVSAAQKAAWTSEMTQALAELRSRLEPDRESPKAPGSTQRRRPAASRPRPKRPR
jgi:hypothetical protein